MLKSNHIRTVAIILAVSLALRWGLILKDGQYYFSDEGRYETSRTFAKLAIDGKLNEAFSQFFIAPEHLGFKIIGIIPAVFEQFTRESLVIPALFFSLFSVLNLFLIYHISKRTGAADRESLTALLLSASSMSLLYYSRHLLPYDTAMTFGLLAVYAALDEKPNFKSSLACGALGFACFITYNGYWPLAVLGMLISSLRGGRSPTKQSLNREAMSILQRGLYATVGFILPAVLLFAVANASGINILKEYRTFSTTVSQGQFDEGWSLPFEYFWHAEHWLFLLLVLLSGYAVFSSEGKDGAINFWAGAAIFIYLCLLIPSVFLNLFVVYGRLARQMLPFLLLLSANGFERLEQQISFGKNLTKILLAMIAIQTAWNYQASYTLTYPREFAKQAQSLRPEFVFSEKRLAFGAPTLCQNRGYVIEYVKHFEVPPEPNPPVQGQLLLSAPHPDNFLPYQYEGYTYDQRQQFRTLQIEMRFYKADDEFMSDGNPIWKTMKSCLVGGE